MNRFTAQHRSLARRHVVLGAALAACMVLAACGSSGGTDNGGTDNGSTNNGSTESSNTGSPNAGTESDTSTPSTGESTAMSDGESQQGSSLPSGQPGSSGSDHVAAQLAKYSTLPTYTAPGPAFDAAKAMKGKTVFSIGVNNADQFVGVIQNSMKQVADSVGFNFEVYTNHGQLNQWVKGMQTAINEKVDVIDLLAGIDPDLLAPQIKAATDAGIKVVVSDAYDVNQKGTTLPVVRADVPYQLAARIDADWIIKDSGGDADVLVIGSSDVKSSTFMVKGIDDEFSKYCPNCQHTDIDITVANWASQTQDQVQAKLNADPNIDYILPVFDSQSQFVVPAITAAGKTGQVKIVTYDGTPFVLKMMQQGDTVVMDVGENLDWIAKAIMDQDMRVAAGLDPVEKLNAPLYIFTDDNVDTAGTPPKNSTGYGDAYQCGYKMLWQLTDSC